MLERDEYIEQAYLFRSLLEHMEDNSSVQDLLLSIREELLATTNLPKAVEFLTAELKLTGGLSEGMRRLSHYFTPFQAFVVGESGGAAASSIFAPRLDVLRREAAFRGEGCSPQASFIYQFECLARIGSVTIAA